MRLLNGFSNGLSDGFLHWVGGKTLASTGTRTERRRPEMRKGS